MAERAGKTISSSARRKHGFGRAAGRPGTHEQAEMHVFRLHEHGLWATMEHES